jgi:glycosyltransferase involved in cell wall biosynthesis
VAAAQRVLIVSEHPYPDHATLRRNVAQVVDGGATVDLLCLAGAKGQGPAGLRVFRLRMEHRRTGALRYLQEYLGFFAWALARASFLSIRHRYAAVLVDNPPDFLVFVSLIARLRGARVVLEMLELVPELTAARMKFERTHPVIRAARLIERVATRYADRLIVVSRQCQEILVSRGASARKMSILPNTPPLLSMPRDVGSPLAEPAFLITHCSLVERYGVQVAIRALAVLRPRWPDLTLEVLGEGEYKSALIELVRELRLEDRVVFRGFLPWTDAMAEIRKAAVGIVAIIADGYGELLFPTKLLEYAEQEVPVVCANLPTIADHFPSDSLAYFDPGDATALAKQVDNLLRNPRAAAQQARLAKLVMRDFSWDVLAPRYMAALGLAF